ncbi:unnamed protein product [Porites lobata]|uniref:Uncharacterized protein n=1 Tax=Porites lobata TaxID=104759 RepID=A0ABN8N9A5_9CNID|nr:unnamed protein product [Porites lobata]
MGSPVHRPDGLAMLMSPKKGETAAQVMSVLIIGEVIQAVSLQVMWKCESTLIFFLVPSSTLLRGVEVWKSLTKVGYFTFPHFHTPEKSRTK